MACSRMEHQNLIFRRHLLLLVRCNCQLLQPPTNVQQMEELMIVISCFTQVHHHGHQNPTPLPRVLPQKDDIQSLSTMTMITTLAHLSTPSQILLLALDPVIIYARAAPFASVENFLVYHLLGRFASRIGYVPSIIYMILLAQMPLFVLMPALHRNGIKQNETLHARTQSRYSYLRSRQFTWKITGRMFAAVHSRKIHDLHAVHESICRMKKMDMKVAYGFRHLCWMGVKLVSLLLMLLERRPVHSFLTTQH